LIKKDIKLYKQDTHQYAVIDGFQKLIIPTDKDHPNGIYDIPELIPDDLEPFNDIELLKWQAKKMIDFAIAKRSSDNITVILVKL
jgi:hypothetical protein